MNELPVTFDEEIAAVVIGATFAVHETHYTFKDKRLTLSGYVSVDGMPTQPRRFDLTMIPYQDGWQADTCFIWPEGE